VKISDTFWLSVLHQVQLVFSVIAGVAFLCVPRMGRKDYRGVGLIILLCVTIQSISLTGSFIFHKNMNSVNNLFDLFGLPIAIMFYQRRIERFSKMAAVAIIIVFLSFGLINYFFIQGINGINSYTYTLSSIGFMCLSVAYFAALFFQLSENQSARGMFWINTAFLIYFSGTFFVNLVIDYLLKFLHSNLIIIWMISNSLGVIMFGLLTYGLIKVRREYHSRIISI
jgi:hypothetical protein